jgi:hypothetical protein
MDYNISAVVDALRKIEKPKATKVFSEKKINVNEVVNWKELQIGDVVRSIQGYGPYFENSKGEKTFQGSYGYYKVSEMVDNGFYAYEHSPRGKKLDFGGRRFIYMGEPKKVDVINRQPHKLIKVHK